MFDMAYSSLLEDLHDRGLLTNTMVLAMGEFGRTPKVNPAGGRDHWPQCWSIMMAGGGVKGGQVIGASDDIGATPKDRPTSPAQVAATIYDGLGISARPGTAGRARPSDSAGGARRGTNQGAVRMTCASPSCRCSCLLPLPTRGVGRGPRPSCPARHPGRPESYHQLLAEAFADNHQEDWTRTAHWTSSNPPSPP
jgi:hypothetical protein